MNFFFSFFGGDLFGRYAALPSHAWMQMPKVVTVLIFFFYEFYRLEPWFKVVISI